MKHGQKDETLLHRLRLGDSETIEKLYRSEFRSCSSFILKNSGKMEDAKDVFNDSLMVLIQNLRRPDFELSSTLGTYLYSINRNLWLKALSRKKNSPEDLIIDDPKRELVMVEENKVEEKVIEESRHNLIQAKIKEMSEECQRILTYSYLSEKKYSQKEIAKAMNYSNSYVKLKKHRCMEELKKLVKSKWASK
ncbi:MAG: sigma-70 family RNA polymerase sigma factor [Bacteroidota bacterium]